MFYVFVTTDRRTSQNHRLQTSQSDQRAHLCVLCCLKKHTNPFRDFKKKIWGSRPSNSQADNQPLKLYLKNSISRYRNNYFIFLFVLSCPLSITFSLHDKNFRVVNESVSNRCGHSGTVKNLSPFRKGQVCRYDGRLPLMPCADNLEK